MKKSSYIDEFSVIVRSTLVCLAFALVFTYQAIGQNPLLEDADRITPFGNCDLVPTKLNPDYKLIVNNISEGKASIASYKINWGDGIEEPLPTGFLSASHIYHSLGMFNLVFTAMVNGLPLSKTYPVSNQSNPSIGISNNGGSTIGCSPLLLSFTITGVEENAPGTSYFIDYGDGTTETRTFEQMLANNNLEHTYLKSSCDAPGIGGQFTLKVNAINSCTSSPAQLGSIRVFKSPIAKFSTVPSGCLNEPISFNNQTESGAGYNCSSGSDTYSWNFGDGTILTDKNPTHKFTQPGSYNVTLTSSNPQCAIGTTTTPHEICINPRPVSAFELSAIEVCKGSLVTATNKSSSIANTPCGALQYLWTVSNYIGSDNCLPNSSSWHFDAGSVLNSVNPVFIFDNAGSYQINLKVTNGCGTITTSKTITVKQVPSVKIIPLNAICVNQSITPTALVNNCFGETTSTYNWQFTGGMPSVSSSKDPSAISYRTSGTYDILLSATNECGTSIAVPMKLKVNDLPNPVITGPAIVCANSKGNVYSTAAGMSNYLWTVSPGGVVISGGTPTSNFITIDWKDADNQTVSLNYDQAGCNAPTPSVLHIKVIPLPAAFSGNPITICGGAPVQIGGPSNAGSSYNWVSEPVGFTSIISAPTVNPLQTTEYFLTETISSGCSRTNSVKVSVNPLPIPVISGPAAVCLGSTAVVYTAAAGMTDYHWAISSGGTITSGGSLTSNTITVSWNNAGLQTISLNYTNENGCTGAVPYDFHVSVNTSQTVSLVGPETVCEQATEVIYTGLAGMTNYNWNISSGGRIISGGDATSNVAEVLWTQPGMQTVSLNYTQPGCPGAVPKIIDVKVNGHTLPIITGASNACAGAKNVTYTTESGKTNYKWEISEGGIIAAGAEGNEILVNWNTSGDQFVKVNYDLDGLCAAIVPTVFNVTVNQLQIPTINGLATSCQGMSNVEYTTEPGMNNYLWEVSGGTITSGSGTNTIFVVWTAPGLQTVGVSYSNRTGCSSPDEVQFQVKVDSAPTASASPETQVICSGSVTNIKLTPSNGTLTYKWSVETISGTVTGAESGSGSTIAQQLINTTTSIGIVRYTIIPSNGTCFGAPIFVDVKVRNLNPTIIGLDKVCVKVAGVTYTTEPGMAGYKWVVSSGGVVTSGVGTNSITVDWNIVGNQTVSISYSNIAGCAGNSAAVYSVNVNPLPAIAIASPTVVCAGSPVTFTTEAGMSNYQWHADQGIPVGDGTATSNSVTFLWNNPGAYNLTLNYENGNGCSVVSPLVSEIIVLPVPLPTISGPQSVCANSGSILYMTQPGKVNYTWMIAGGQIILGGKSTSSSATVVWDNSGNHSIGVNYSNGECMAPDPTIFKVNVNLAPTFTVSEVTGCTPLTVILKNTSSSGAENYTWDFNDGTKYTTSNADEVVTHTFNNELAGSKTFVVKLISSSESGCTLTSEQTIKVEPEYSVGYPVSQRGCSPYEVKFDNARPGSKSYSWLAEDGTVLSTESNPTLKFNAKDGKETTYVVRLTGESFSGCKSKVINTITVLPLPKADFTQSVSEGCSPLNVKFSNNSSEGAKTYIWDFGDGSIPVSLANPEYTFISPEGNPEIYPVNLIARNEFGCVDAFKSVVKVLPTPQADFSVNPLEQSLPSGKILLTNLTQFGPWDYTWQFGDQTAAKTGTVSEHEYSKAGYYTVSLTAKGNVCSSTKKIGVTINERAPGTAFDCDTEGCAPFSVKFNNYSVNGFKFLWDFGNGNHSTEFEPKITYYEGGTYKVRLEVYNSLGEMTFSEKVITVHDQASAFFRVSANRVQIPGNSVYFVNLSENAFTLLWDFGDGTTSTDFEPVYEYARTGVFKATLSITTAFNCKDEYILSPDIEIYSDEIKVANAFIPAKEGSSGGIYVPGDPRNHIFHPNLVSGDVVEYEFQIFNRWGNLFFQSNEVERGWDGYYNGKLCPQDVYVWKIRCKFANGELVTKVGDVTLIQ